MKRKQEQALENKKEDTSSSQASGGFDFSNFLGQESSGS